MKALFISLGLICIPLAGFSATINVPVDYSTIQDAINAANNGDIVIVAPGTYVETIDFLGKAITVTSSGGPEVTTIDGNQTKSVVTFLNGETLDSILDGFTVTGGKEGTSGLGGGIIILGSSPLIQNNIIKNNIGNRGGGIYVEFSSCLIRNNTVCQNQGDLGGGLYARGDHADIMDNLFTGNTANLGGGGYFSISSESDFVGNSVTSNTAIRGGGLYCYYHDNHISIRENEFASNNATEGGGLLCGNSTGAVVSGNFIHHNIAEKYGGGIRSEASNATIENNIFAWNSAGWHGGGLSCMGSPPMSIAHNTLYGNMAAVSGGGMYFFGGLDPFVVMNTIFWNNDAPKGTEIAVGFAPATAKLSISYCDVKGGQGSVFVDTGSKLNWGDGMIDDHPFFVEPVLNDFHINYQSPCRDAGINKKNNPSETDFEGDPRVAFGTVDIGADEFYTHLYYKGNAIPGGSIKVVFVGVPFTDPVILVVGSGVADPPLPTAYGDLYLELPLILFDTKATLQLYGIYSLSVDLPLTYPAPYDVPLQALIGSELTNLSELKVR